MTAPMTRHVSSYRNYILNDPILDYLNVYGSFLGYRPDNSFKNFNKDLLLDTYISKNKNTFISKIQNSIKGDGVMYNYTTQRGTIDLVVPTRDLHKYFTGTEYSGDGVSVFTIEYAHLHKSRHDKFVSKNKQQKYYALKNWLLYKEASASGLIVDHSFIIGRSVVLGDNRVYSKFNYLLKNEMTFQDIIVKADEYLNNLHKLTIGMSLFPNMKNKTDFPWHNAKKLIADKIKEISLVRNVSISQRNEYFASGKINYTQIDHTMVKNKEVLKITNKHPLPDISTCLFIDFEILTSVYDDFTSYPESNKSQWIFNIGCGYTKRKNFYFNSYVAKELIGEEKVIRDFIEFIDSRDSAVVLVHWTDIEKRTLNQKLKQYGITPKNQIHWFDLHDYFIKSGILIRNCLNYKLKVVSRYLHQYGLIKSKWDRTFSDGLGAMTGYILYLKTGDESIIKNITHYNMIDCKVLYEIMELLAAS
jgi:hypothetical protein